MSRSVCAPEVGCNEPRVATSAHSRAAQIGCDHVVLGGIDFEVEPSQVVVVIVPSGSGKSTLLRCCNSLEVPESGSVKICGRMLINNGQPLPEAELDLLRRDVGMVFQSFNADRLIEFLGALGHRCAVEEER